LRYLAFMNLQRRSTAAVVLASLLGLAAIEAAGAASFPYSTTFPDASGWVNANHGTPASWGVVTGGYQAVTGATNAYSYDNNYAAVQIAGLGAAVPANSFTETTDLTVTAASGGDYYVGLGALASSGTAGFDNSGIEARISNGGTIQIHQNGASLLSQNTSFTLSANTAYTLTLQGSYDAAGALTLTFTVDDAAHSLAAQSVSTTLAAGSAATGNYFGLVSDFTNTSGVSTSSVTTLFGDFSVASMAAVPEPSEYALLAFGCGCGLALLRRRSRSAA